MAKWLSITVDTLNEAKVAALVEACSTAAKAGGQPDRVDGLIQGVVDEIRRKIGSCPRNQVDSDLTKIPKGLRDMAVDMIIARLKNAVELDATEDERRALLEKKNQENDAKISLEQSKKEVEVKISKSEHIDENAKRISICLSLLKNANRFEWFLEKATELGITELVPMICERTERQHFRMSRMKNILVSAMLQSRQFWVPLLHEPVPFNEVIRQSMYEQRFIAHCMDDLKAHLIEIANKSALSYIMLIGPEGDFSPQEVSLAVQNQFIPISLGETRLRSETAGVVAATLIRLW
jgi:16S rRNA (uracil1498-N3)-methyltransferase